MEQDKSGVDVAQSTSQEEQTSQSEQPYRVFSTEQEYKDAQDKFFKGAYNEGKSKAQRDVLSAFSDMFGEPIESLEDVTKKVQGYVQPKKEQESEAEELRRLLQEQKEALEQAKEEAYFVKMEANIGNQFASALSDLSKEGDLSLKQDYVEQLFYNEYEIDEQNGQYFVAKDGVPVLDESGNRQSVANAFKSFIKSNGFIKPTKKGVGTNTGAVDVTGDKPSRSEWRKLIRSNSPDAQERVAQMYSMAQQVGWAE